MTAVATSAPSPSLPYMARPVNRALVLGTFFVVTLPLAAFLLVGNQTMGDDVFKAPIVQLYVVLFGSTHFFLTFTVYLSAANRQFFTSTLRNVLVFLVAPLGPLALVALWYGLALSDRFPVANGLVFFVIRALAYYHLTRQAFGVLQLFKGKGMKPMPAWTRTAENLFFIALTVQMLVTYKTDLRFDPRSTVTWIVLAACAVLFAIVCVAYGAGLRAGADRKQTAIAFAYFAVQTGSCALTVWLTGLYSVALAVHYVEYHIVMAPRVLRGEAGAKDKTLQLFKRAPIALYATLLMASALWWIMVRAQDSITQPGGARMLVHLFDGIFVFHYILEMQIWKFSDPYFRKSLGPLYV